MKKKSKASKILYWTVVGILIFIIIGCAVLIVGKFLMDASDKSDYDELSEKRASVAATRPTLPSREDLLPEQTDPVAGNDQAPEGSATAPNPNIDDTVILEYQALYEMNHDMVGWIQIPNTNVDYPVVQTPQSPNFYLRRNFYKESATCGTIYAREACDINLPSDNITLYGHNMRNGTMFADLHKYKNKSFWEKNRFVYFDTLSEYHTYEIFSVFTTTADLTKGFTYHIYDTFYEEADFNNFVSSCKNLDYYETGINPVFGDKLLTLSTCDKSMNDGRLVVVCRRIF